jgi:hypothetical protein
MRKFLAIALMALTLVACEREYPTNPSRKIDFASQLSRSMVNGVEGVRAQQISLYASYTYEGGSARVFDAERLYYNAEISAWDYDHPQYWLMGAYYRFCAVSPYTIRGTYADWGELVVSGYESYTGAPDLLYAAEVRDLTAVDDFSTVQLRFRHACSGVQFSIVNGSSSVLTDVRNIRLVGLHNKGDFSFRADGTAMWNFTSDVLPAESDEYPFAGVCVLPEGGLPVNIAVEHPLYDSGAVLVLPQSIYKSSVTLHLEYKKQGDSEYAVRNIELGMLGGSTPTEWKAGELYKYKLNITDNTITAEVKVVDWIDNYVDL